MCIFLCTFTNSLTKLHLVVILSSENEVKLKNLYRRMLHEVCAMSRIVWTRVAKVLKNVYVEDMRCKICGKEIEKGENALKTLSNIYRHFKEEHFDTFQFIKKHCCCELVVYELVNGTPMTWWTLSHGDLKVCRPGIMSAKCHDADHEEWEALRKLLDKCGKVEWISPLVWIYYKCVVPDP